MTSDSADLSGLVGASEPELDRRLGPPESRRRVHDDVWLVFDAPAGRLRVRCAPDASGVPRVAAWTVTLSASHATLASAAGAVGLWPAAAPDAVAARAELPLVRRALPVGGGAGALHSMTATVRAGRFDRISVFDEAPDWL